MGRVFATADIGSNTVHLLVAETDGQTIRRLHNESEWLSLGEIVGRERQIPPVLSDRLLAVLERYSQIATSHNALTFYVFATEAMRIAENHEEVLARIKKNVKLSVDLITPIREAELSWRGVQLDAEGVSPAALIEIGGGSAQIAICDGFLVAQEVSLPLGTGRILAQTELSYPPRPSQLDAVRRTIEEQIPRIASFERPRRIVASGGVARGIWRALHPDGERNIHLEELRFLEWSVQRLPLERIASRFNVRSKRAQTMLPGAMAFRMLMESLGQESMFVSEYGVRDGAILELAETVKVKNGRKARN
jgi:exopolyphosphatase / guanosine-5'-triphosphate,3'-diphosphate pyrophosphatase